ncbi:MAG: yflN 1 [Planctomycetaceae bacterium]|nr:yflN 1 [Planctomycetaceae bacterium]
MIVQTESPAMIGQEKWPHRVSDNVWYLQTGIVNVCFVGSSEPPADRGWCLIDAGLKYYSRTIIDAAERLFGARNRPFAIILTHGHFDHVGCAAELADYWDAPILAHPLELPYLIGKSPYPPPDPTVGGGLMSSLSWLYPRGPVDFGDRVQRLPGDGSVPGLPEWRWVHTPGHTAGHISLFRDRDQTLIAGDAFITVKQESLLAVLAQSPEIHGPPTYFTPDWTLARKSVEKLADLDPSIAITGHGVPLAGETLRSGLDTLIHNFNSCAVPHYGRYSTNPAITDFRGLVSIPPDVTHPVRNFLTGALVGLLIATSAGLWARQARDT